MTLARTVYFHSGFHFSCDVFVYVLYLLGGLYCLLQALARTRSPSKGRFHWPIRFEYYLFQPIRIYLRKKIQKLTVISSVSPTHVEMNKIEIIQPQKFKSVPFNRSDPTLLISHSQRLEISVFLESLCQHKRPAHVKSALRPVLSTMNRKIWLAAAD